MKLCISINSWYQSTSCVSIARNPNILRFLTIHYTFR